MSKDAEHHGEDQALRWARSQNIIRLTVGRSSKMVKGRSPSAQRLLIASPCPNAWQGPIRRDDAFSLKQKGGQIFTMSYPKMAEILPSIRSRRPNK